MSPYDTLLDDLEDLHGHTTLRAVLGTPYGLGYGAGDDTEVLHVIVVGRQDRESSATAKRLGRVLVELVDVRYHLSNANIRRFAGWSRARLGTVVRDHAAYGVVEDYLDRAYPPDVLAQVINGRAAGLLAAWDTGRSVGLLADALVHQGLAELYRRGPWAASDLPVPSADDVAPALARAGLLSPEAVDQAHLLLEAHRTGDAKGPFVDPTLHAELVALNDATTAVLGRGRPPLHDPSPQSVYELTLRALAEG